MKAVCEVHTGVRSTGETPPLTSVLSANHKPANRLSSKAIGRHRVSVWAWTEIWIQGGRLKQTPIWRRYSEKSISLLSANVSSAESSRALLSDRVLILRWDGMRENADEPLKWPDVLLAILNCSFCHSSTFPTSAYISRCARERMRVCILVSDCFWCRSGAPAWPKQRRDNPRVPCSCKGFQHTEIRNCDFQII